MMMAGYEVVTLKFHRRPAAGLDFNKLNNWRESLRRTFVKTAAYWAAWAGSALYYWLLKDFPYTQYASYYDFLRLILPWALFITPFYMGPIYVLDPKELPPSLTRAAVFVSYLADCASGL
jgi:hypothetical protein